ncbi:hypothetical protein HYFRA_00011599 [Hymenoscyphus fraxineus]|uniref:Uncharacterized protein n=1 Tax=Hymenoscyphus fraxineus TaxID=746836 RepID=A0A9N9L6R5_9HELO|nr:hypothetical protein HYFRA_00011599 [Hymenoscyphus fraxineus]
MANETPKPSILPQHTQEKPRSNPPMTFRDSWKELPHKERANFRGQILQGGLPGLWATGLEGCGGYEEECHVAVAVGKWIDMGI